MFVEVAVVAAVVRSTCCFEARAGMPASMVPLIHDAQHSKNVGTLMAITR